MRKIWQVVAGTFVCLALALTVVTVVGCTSKTKTTEAMGTGKMSGDKMETGKMNDGKMETGKMSGEKMSGDKMSTGKMSGDKMSTGKMEK
jgi:pentapeptide MXKDX repeat protein